MASVSEVESKPSTSTCPEISDKDIEAIFAKGKRHYICQETILAYKSFGDVCTKLSAKYGQTANECGEAYLYYGKSLLDIARMENGVLGNALKAGPAVEEDDEEDLPNQEGPSLKDIPDDERSQVRQDVKEALKVAPIEPDFTLPSAEYSEKKEEAMEEEGSGSTTEGKEKKEEAMEEEGSGVVDAKEEKEGEVMKDGEEKSKEGADLESLPISPESEKTEDDADNDDDADADDDEDVNDDDDTEAENTETAEDDGTEEGKSDEHPEDVPDMQLAWEMLELARLIFARQEGKEMKLKQAEANNTLGEISMELEHYAEAVGDFSECLRLQDPVLDADDRLRAETHYNLGLSYTLDKHYEKAIEHFKKAIKSIECRITNIEKKIEEEQNKKGKEKVEADSPLASWRKEVEELKDLLPDMAAKIEDAEETKRSADITARAVKEIAKEFMGSASSAFDAPTMPEEKSSNGFDTPTINEDGTPQDKKNQASDISYLVRKKLEPSDISHLVKKVEPSDISHLVKKRKKEDDSEGDEMETKKARQTEECKEDTKKECKEETTDQKPAVEKPAVEERKMEEDAEEDVMETEECKEDTKKESKEETTDKKPTAEESSDIDAPTSDGDSTLQENKKKVEEDAEGDVMETEECKEDTKTELKEEAMDKKPTTEESIVVDVPTINGDSTAQEKKVENDGDAQGEEATKARQAEECKENTKKELKEEETTDKKPTVEEEITDKKPTVEEEITDKKPTVEKSSGIDAPTIPEEQVLNGIDASTINEDGTPQDKKSNGFDAPTIIEDGAPQDKKSSCLDAPTTNGISTPQEKKRKMEDDAEDEMETKKVRQTEECKEDTRKGLKEETMDEKPAVENTAVEEVMETA